MRTVFLDIAKYEGLYDLTYLMFFTIMFVLVVYLYYSKLRAYLIFISNLSDKQTWVTFIYYCFELVAEHFIAVHYIRALHLPACSAASQVHSKTPQLQESHATYRDII